MQKYFPMFYPAGPGSPFSIGAMIGFFAAVGVASAVVTPLVKKITSKV